MGEVLLATAEFLFYYVGLVWDGPKCISPRKWRIGLIVGIAVIFGPLLIAVWLRVLARQA